jgi:hypothetical protein
MRLTGLMLVFSLDLQNIKEVCGGSVDLNDIFVALRLGVREVGHGELLGALKPVVSMPYPLRHETEEVTWTSQ